MSIRTPLLAALVVTALVPPALATAKEIENASICGAGACKEVAASRGDHELLGGRPSASAPKPGPFYRLRIGVGDGSGRVFERLTFAYVPSEGKLRPPHGTWTDLSERAQRMLASASRGLAPLRGKAFAVADAPTRGTSLPPEVYRVPEQPSTDEGAPIGTLAIGAAGLALLAAAVHLFRRRVTRRSRPAPTP